MEEDDGVGFPSNISHVVIFTTNIKITDDFICYLGILNNSILIIIKDFIMQEFLMM